MIRIYGDSISGNCLKVKWTADWLGLPYEWVETSVREGKTRTEEFLAINPAGQVPAIVLEDGEALSQSNAIVLFLSRKYGGGLLPADPLTHGRVLQWMFWEQYSLEPVIAVRRAQKVVWGRKDEEIDPSLLERGQKVLALLQRQLEDRLYLVGNRLTAADIAVLGYTRVAHEGGYDLAAYPDLRRWISAIERELNIAPATSKLQEAS